VAVAVKMMAKMRIGPKGQVVIPKHFRDDFGLKLGEVVVVDYTGNELVIRKAATNIAEIARAIAMSGKRQKVTIAQIKKLYHQELDKRYERALRHRISGQ